MTPVEARTGRWSARSLARFGGVLGLAIALVLTARLIQVQIRPGGAGLGFALAYGGILLVPFVGSLAALISEGRRRAGVWMVAGVLAILLSFTSVAGATLPLLVPAILLIAAGWRASSEAPQLKGPA